MTSSPCAFFAKIVAYTDPADGRFGIVEVVREGERWMSPHIPRGGVAFNQRGPGHVPMGAIVQVAQSGDRLEFRYEPEPVR